MIKMLIHENEKIQKIRLINHNHQFYSCLNKLKFIFMENFFISIGFNNNIVGRVYGIFHFTNKWMFGSNTWTKCNFQPNAYVFCQFQSQNKYLPFLFIPKKGLLSAIPLSYIIPGLIFLKLDPHTLFSREKLPAIALVVFGLVVSISGESYYIFKTQLGRVNYCLLSLCFSLFSTFSPKTLLGALVLIPTLFDPNLDCKYIYILLFTNPFSISFNHNKNFTSLLNSKFYFKIFLIQYRFNWYCTWLLSRWWSLKFDYHKSLHINHNQTSITKIS